MKNTISILTVLALAFSLSQSANAANSKMHNDRPITTLNTVHKVSPFCLAISKGDLVTVKKLIELGHNVNETSEGLTPLMYAARYNKVEIIKVLIANGAKLTAKNEKGFTALKYAELSNATEAMAVLQEALKK
ncbi:ankyrin repeat domain-containing protein [Sinomicrobium sp.]